MEIDLKKGGSRASGSQADDLESVGSRPKLEITVGLANLVAHYSGPSRPLSPNVVIDPPKSVELKKVSASAQNYPTVPTECRTFLNLTARFEYSYETRNP